MDLTIKNDKNKANMIDLNASQDI